MAATSFPGSGGVLSDVTTPTNFRLIDLVFHFPEKPWGWFWLSSNPNIMFQDVLDHPDKPWDWAELSRNPNITVQDVLDHPDKEWNWK